MLRESETRRWMLAITLLAVGTLLPIAWTRPDYTGLYGPYCARRFNERSCCAGRQDDCSVPILGTLCYCDDFCSNRTTEEDCCPDFWSYCRDSAPPTIILGRCTHKNRTYNHGEKFMENCNTCKCSSIDDNPEVLCEENVCLMDQEVIDRINILENPGWLARNYTSFWGRTLDDGLNLRLGTLNPSHSIYRMEVLRNYYDPNELPKEFDARIRWPREVHPVRDQEWCGASWAISTADVASDRFAIMSKGAEVVRLSAQQLVSCNSRVQKGCNGGYVDRAWIYMRKYGVVHDQCYCWLGANEKCRIPRRGQLTEVGCKPRNPYSLRNEYFKVGPAYRLANETDIMHEILTNGPVQATMRVYQDFFHYESGIYVHSPLSEHRPSRYHSVRIIGWGEEPSQYTGEPVKFWRVANSWGREWGEDGYFRILRGINECEIESYVIGVWPKTI